MDDLVPVDAGRTVAQPRGAHWTPERIDELKRLWGAGLSLSAIAKTLGNLTRNQVVGKVHRLGLSGRPSPLISSNRAWYRGAPSPAPGEGYPLSALAGSSAVRLILGLGPDAGTAIELPPGPFQPVAARSGNRPDRIPAPESASNPATEPVVASGDEPAAADARADAQPDAAPTASPEPAVDPAVAGDEPVVQTPSAPTVSAGGDPAVGSAVETLAAEDGPTAETASAEAEPVAGPAAVVAGPFDDAAPAEAEPVTGSPAAEADPVEEAASAGPATAGTPDEAEPAALSVEAGPEPGPTAVEAGPDEGTAPAVAASADPAVETKAVEAPAKRKVPGPPAQSSIEALFGPRGVSAAVDALKIMSCRWPIGDPRDGDFHFCGAPKKGKTYCAAHERLAYQEPQARSRNASRLAVRVA